MAWDLINALKAIALPHAPTHGSAGNDSVTPAAIGASATGHSHVTSDHASRHGSAGPDPVTPAAIGAATSGHAHPQSVVSFPPVNLTDAATVATNAALGTLFRLSTVLNPTIGIPTNAVDGQQILYEITASGAARTPVFATGSTGAFETGGIVTSASVVIASGKVAYVRAIYREAAVRWRLLAVDVG